MGWPIIYRVGTPRLGELLAEGCPSCPRLPSLDSVLTWTPSHVWARRRLEPWELDTHDYSSRSIADLNCSPGPEVAHTAQFAARWIRTGSHQCGALRACPGVACATRDRPVGRCGSQSGSVRSRVSRPGLHGLHMFVRTHAGRVWAAEESGHT